MKQNDIKKKLTISFLVIIAIALFWGAGHISATAAQKIDDMSMFSGVTVSPDKTAWTTDYLDKSNECLEKGYTINTGVM